MKTIVITSGGLDSTILLHHLISQGVECRALAIDYGQKHRIELQYATRNAQDLGIPFQIGNFWQLADLLPGSSQTTQTVAVPTGHYASENMKVTVVPNRNMILLAIAVGHAIAHKMDSVAYAAHAGDHSIYPDCRPEFVDRLNDAVGICDWSPMTIIRPFINKTKTEIVKIGAALGAKMHQTYSCYRGEAVHCGRCGTCVERRESFLLAGVPDPTPYDPSAPSLESLLKLKSDLAVV